MLGINPFDIWQPADINNTLLCGNNLYTNFTDEQNTRHYFLANDELLDLAEIVVE